MDCVDWIAPSAPAGTSSGEISVARMASRVGVAASPTRPRSATQRIRCWISVLATPPLTL
ncbi:hypothetical protein D3C77_171050 [compost metagenome]